MIEELKQQIEDISKVHPSLLEEAKEITKYNDNQNNKGFINDNGSSMLLKESGEISLAADLYSHYKIIPGGHSVETTVQSNTITNRKQIKTDEIIVNKHKLNPAIYELADMRQYDNNSYTAIGNLTMMSTVLVKAWEPTLKKWVLIRRLARIPMFSPIMNLADSPEQMCIDTDISQEILNLSSKKE